MSDGCPRPRAWCSRVTRFRRLGPAEVISEVLLDREQQGHDDFVHGGVLAALLDEAVGRAVTIEAPGRVLVTAKLDVQYEHPVMVETVVQIWARVVSDHRFLVQAVAEARLMTGKVAARAHALLARPPSALSKRR